MWPLIHDFCRLLRDWWEFDRPRVSPREGRLLAIEPAAILRIGSQVAEVVGRSVAEGAAGPLVVYHCLCGEQTCELQIKPLPSGRCASIRWTRSGEVRELDEDEVEVFQAK